MITIERKKLEQVLDDLICASSYCNTYDAIDVVKEALAQGEQSSSQEPVAYDKTELNCFAQDLYDQKMREGKRAHYESMFHVIHQCIKKVALLPKEQQSCDKRPWGKPWVSLTEYEKSYALQDKDGITLDYEDYADAIEAKLKEKNT